MNSELCDVLNRCYVDTIIVRYAGVNLRASIVLLKFKQLNPMAAMVLQRPSDESQLPRSVFNSLDRIFIDPPHLLSVSYRIDHMSRSWRNQIQHLQTFFRKSLTHDDVSLKEHILVSDRSDGRHNSSIRNVVYRVEHMQPHFLMLR